LLGVEKRTHLLPIAHFLCSCCKCPSLAQIRQSCLSEEFVFTVKHGYR